MPVDSDLAAFILAGGKSSRMGTDKAFVILDGRTLLQRSLSLARSATSKVRIVGPAEKFAAFAPAVEDIFPGCGPLGGIHAALRTSPVDLNLFLAVDLPFLSPALLQFLVSQARNFPSALVTVPQGGGRLQPLCAVYRRAFAEFAENALQQGRYKIDALFSVAPTKVIHEEALQCAGFASYVFRNLNTPEDLTAAHEST